MSDDEEKRCARCGKVDCDRLEPGELERAEAWIASLPPVDEDDVEPPAPDGW